MLNTDIDQQVDLQDGQSSLKTPEVQWQTPEPIAYGTRLGPAQLNATSSVPGTFVYVPAKGFRLLPGTHTIWVTFTPADSKNYATEQCAVPLSVTLATPVIEWPNPAPVAYGTPLSAAQLNAKTEVPGVFAYTPAAEHVLPPGVQTLTVYFTPADPSKYTVNQATVSLNVTKAKPVITWPSPDPIVYGTPLGDNELKATASVPGSFAYAPGQGAVLSAGTHMPLATFTPSDSVNYSTAQTPVLLTVTKATPTISWPTPAPISYGAALSETELNATASVPGTFVYSPALGDVPKAGDQTLSVTFFPADSVDYTTATASVTLTITKAAPTVIHWPAPPEISFGEPLGPQLNATTSEPGSFIYSPSAGEVLSPGTHTLSVAFIPADENLSSSDASVSLVVNRATPVIKWHAPLSMPYGTPLSDAQLNATASVLGILVYKPAAGEIPQAGKQTLSVDFVPEESNHYTDAHAEVSIVVTKGNPTITWPTPAPISYGSPLTDSEFNATASIPGTFAFAPAKGTVLTPGTQTLEAIFTPEDSANYAPARASVSLVVTSLPYMDALPKPKLDRPIADRPFADASSWASSAKLTVIEPPPATGPLYPNSQIAPEPFFSNSQITSEPSKVNGPVTGGRKSKNEAPKELPSQEVRVYKGATYLKGEDGKWHLKQ